MKKLFLSLTLLIGFFVTGFSQDIVTYIKSNDHKAIATLITEATTIKVNNNKKVTGKEACINVIKDFLLHFGNSQVRGTHQGSTGNVEENYIVVSLENKQKAVARLFIHMDKERKIKSVKIRKS